MSSARWCRNERMDRGHCLVSNASRGRFPQSDPGIRCRDLSEIAMRIRPFQSFPIVSVRTLSSDVAMSCRSRSVWPWRDDGSGCDPSCPDPGSRRAVTGSFYRPCLRPRGVTGMRHAHKLLPMRRSTVDSCHSPVRRDLVRRCRGGTGADTRLPHAWWTFVGCICGRACRPRRCRRASPGVELGISVASWDAVHLPRAVLLHRPRRGPFRAHSPRRHGHCCDS